jgi:predicted flap endonuclease-1-like 5' DNA nuclease
MDYKIEEVEGIGPSYGAKLKKAGIEKTSHFLEFCATSKGRKQTADKTGISETHLLKWANMADLMRINGVGKQFAELLEASGVDTVKELKMRKPENLAAKMSEVNEAKKLTRSVPAESQVETWVKEAGEMKPMISH